MPAPVRVVPMQALELVLISLLGVARSAAVRSSEEGIERSLRLTANVASRTDSPCGAPYNATRLSPPGRKECVMKLLWGVAIAACALLLLALQAVVGQSVRQGEARRVQVARHADAMSTCGRLQARTARESCRAGSD